MKDNKLINIDGKIKRDYKECKKIQAEMESLK